MILLNKKKVEEKLEKIKSDYSTMAIEPTLVIGVFDEILDNEKKQKKAYFELLKILEKIIPLSCFTELHYEEYFDEKRSNEFGIKIGTAPDEEISIVNIQEVEDKLKEIKSKQITEDIIFIAIDTPINWKIQMKEFEKIIEKLVKKYLGSKYIWSLNKEPIKCPTFYYIYELNIKMK